PHVLLQERPIALGNLLKEAGERRAIAGLDWSNLHAAPCSGRVAVIDDPAGQLWHGVLERRPAGAKRDVTAREPKLLAARGVADERHHRLNGGRRDDVVALRHRVEDVALDVDEV